MPFRYRIPITAITVFGSSSLLAISVGIVLYLGFNQAAETTRLLWAEQSSSLIDAMELSLDAKLRPIRDQALWVAEEIKDLSDPSSLDKFIMGTLAATPQVAGVAVITTTGLSRRWQREERQTIDEDWSQRPWMRNYLKQVELDNRPAWREPIFTETIGTSTLLHDVALHDHNGKFIGIFAQIVSLPALSGFLSRSYADTGVTPFVLYNRDFILAHPRFENGNHQQPLPHLDHFGDLVLQRIWSPDRNATFIAEVLKDIQTSGFFWGDDYYMFLYRDLERYGPAPWTIGAYLNTTLLADDQTDNIFRALSAGLIVLLFAIIASIIVGRKVSKPIQEIVHAADAVEADQLESITPLGASRIKELDEANSAFNKMVSGLRESKMIRETLGRYVPEKVASSLLAGGGELEVQETEASILFCDIEAFTKLTEALGPIRIVEVLNAYFSRMVEILEHHGGVVTQFQGDAILATFNVPMVDPAHAYNAVLAAQVMLTSVAGSEYAGERLKIRIGINTGSVVAGAIGAKGRLNYTVHGDAVNLAARLESLNKVYGTQLLIAQSTAAQVDEIELIPVAETIVRGQTKSIQLYSLK